MWISDEENGALVIALKKHLIFQSSAVCKEVVTITSCPSLFSIVSRRLEYGLFRGR
jgi:hypothetical protein